jgi:uncharacterized protein YqcC (DUF446 family)
LGTDAARARIAAQLDEIEAELKRIGFWHPDPPDLQRRFSIMKLKTYLDAPTFELWLQCIFLPNARRAVEVGELPKESQVGLMAMRQYDYHSYVEEAQRLVALLHDFDRLVESNEP